MGKRKRVRQKKRGILSVFFLILAIGLLLYGVFFFKETVEPNMESIAKMQAKTIVGEIVNDAIGDQFGKETTAENLLTIRYNKNDEIELVQSNTKAMNILISDLSRELEKEYLKLEPTVVKVPVGSLLGSKVLSQAGPDINLKVIPFSVSGTDFKTEFESQGINQTKYKVYIILESQVKVLAPFSEKTFSFRNTILIAEAVILGNVPKSYVRVPEKNILDVMD